MMNLQTALCLHIVVVCLIPSMVAEGPRKYLSPEERMLKKYVFTNASRHWKHYLRKLLHNSLQTYFPKIPASIPDFLLIRLPTKVVQNLNKYLPISDNALNCLFYLSQHVKLFLAKQKQVQELEIVSLITSGWFLVGNKTVFEPLKTSFLKGANQRQNSVLHFILDPNLHLNLSVHYIYFSSNAFLKCQIASLTVFSFIQNHDKRFKYCGVVPSFLLYPSSYKVIISVEIASYQVTFDSIITHSVIDSDKIITYQMKSRRLLVPISVIRFLATELCLLRYELEVERYKTLLILYSIRQNYTIVMYAYKNYSNISLNLSVSTSPCEAIPINICEQEYDPLSLESNRILSIKRQSCIVLQLDYGQENFSFFKKKSINKLESYIEISDGAYLKRGK